jgi:predicted kinase
MPKFEVTFKDEIEVENEEEAVEALIQYLNDCVRFKDVSVFNFYKLKEEKND